MVCISAYGLLHCHLQDFSLQEDVIHVGAGSVDLDDEIALLNLQTSMFVLSIPLLYQAILSLLDLQDAFPVVRNLLQLEAMALLASLVQRNCYCGLVTPYNVQLDPAFSVWAPGSS